MKQTLLDKLVAEIRRYQSKDFLKAAMAVCALAANADDEVNLAERYSIDHIRVGPRLWHIYEGNLKYFINPLYWNDFKLLFDVLRNFA